MMSANIIWLGDEKQDDEKGLQLYTDLASGELFFRMHTEISIAQIRITDLNGKVLYTSEIPIEQGSWQSLDISTFVPGMYLLDITGKDGLYFSGKYLKY